MFVLSLRLALKGLKQRLISRMLVVFSMSCLLVMIGGLCAGLKSFSKMLVDVKSSQFVALFIDASVSDKEESGIISAVKKIPNVETVEKNGREKFVENLSRFFPELAEDLAKIDQEAIPRYLKVKSNNAQETASLAAKIKGIESVETNSTRYQGLTATLSVLIKLCIFLSIGLTFALLSMIVNHIKSSSSYERQVAQALRSLGSKKTYSAVVSSIQGIVEGLAAGVLAAGFFYFSGNRISTELGSVFSGMGYKPYTFEFGGIALLLLGLGVCSGMIGSLWAIGKNKA